MRVHELAKKLKITSKDIIAELKKRGVEVKNHMELLDSKVVETFLKKSTPVKPAAVAKAEPTTLATVKKEKTVSRGATRPAKIKSPTGSKVKTAEKARAQEVAPTRAVPPSRGAIPTKVTQAAPVPQAVKKSVEAPAPKIMTALGIILSDQGQFQYLDLW